jgi:ketosteroid isomerase-like protein
VVWVNLFRGAEMDIETIRKLYRLVDRLDSAALVSHLTPDAVLIVANNDPLHGREEIRNALDSVFCELDGVHHEIHDVWRVDGKTRGVFVAHADAYFRVRGAPEAIFIRGALIFRVQNGAIACARALYDLTPLYEAIQVPRRVFEGVDESFPASDSPSWMP